jgi:PST family polysaccharide transporter
MAGARIIGEAAVVVACLIGLRAHWGALFQTGRRGDVPAI